MHIKQLSASDATQYRMLMLQAYAFAADAFTSTVEEREAEPEAFWIKRIGEQSGLSAVFGAFADTALVGTVAIEFSAKPKTKHKASVIGMYVAPEARGTGASRGLLAAIIDCAKAREGVRQLILTVTEGNDPALHLYQKAGFQSFGVEPMAILTPEGYKAKVHMWLRLRSDAS